MRACLKPSHGQIPGCLARPETNGCQQSYTAQTANDLDRERAFDEDVDLKWSISH